MDRSTSLTPSTMTSYTVTVECGNGNGYDGRLGLRVSSIFVIGFGSFCGMFATCDACHEKSSIMSADSYP